MQELPFTTDNAEFNALLGGEPRHRLRPPAGHHAEHGQRDQSRSEQPAADELLPVAVGPLRLQLRRLTSSTRPATTGMPAPSIKQLYFRQALQSMVDQPAMISKFLKGYGVPTYGPVPVLPEEQPGRRVRAVEPVPLQPVARQEPPDVARVEGRAQRRRHLPEARDGSQRLRSRHPQGCAAELHHDLRQRDAVAAADDDGRAVGLELHRHQDRPGRQHLPDRDSGLRRAVRVRDALHGRRGLVGRRLGVQPGLLPLR